MVHRISLVVLTFAFAIPAFAQQAARPAAAPELKTVKQQASYGVGLNIGGQLLQ